MGLASVGPTRPFLPDDVANKDLVIAMLKKEESLVRSEFGQAVYSNPLNRPLISLNVEKSFNRLTLSQFGFDTSDTSVANYRTIFGHYYKSPTDFDKEVLDSVHYMRENKCVYYKANPLIKGQLIPDCRLYNLDGETTVGLHDLILREAKTHTVIAAFSLS